MAVVRVRAVGSFLIKWGFCGTDKNSVLVPVNRMVTLRSSPSAPGPEKITDEFIRKQKEEFEAGRRQLANMMGEDPESFSQQDVDRSVSYLFPSGLFEKKARPIMKPPEEIFPKQRTVQWDADGRPFHFLFYTGKQSYYSLMHDLYDHILSLEKKADRLRSKGMYNENAELISFGSSRWLTKDELQLRLVENVADQEYERFLRLMERLVVMPHSAALQDMVMQYRHQLETQSTKQTPPQLLMDERGVAYSTAEGHRKTSEATVIVRDAGGGRISINGEDQLTYFTVLQDRVQLMFPLQFIDALGRFDVECTVSGGGRSSQAGALRLAISRALLGFVSESQGEAMRRAGLLTPDPRVRERKKPGQEGARRKYTWKKR
ncbi:small ribosomal subunit protein uS9m [Gouania willdenowi]|uniref:small ribosomal subunit protein uS9m n=1 Tax=Gouania willdenowi TaxID=441366 RepID=UPI0010553574|nr:28S ribosomal protein S9, mitochondrial [Gouania willdenowi]XP_028318977.1 28S ribosomal protein S9, mitochondrial [Gouania willdenowi]